MLPTREQFKDFISAINYAQEKEDKLDKAFELIWDDDQAQYVPFLVPFSSMFANITCLLRYSKLIRRQISGIIIPRKAIIERKAFASASP